MKKQAPCSQSIWEAIQVIRQFIAETTDAASSDEEIADALKRYFVLNEIKEHILLARNSIEETNA